MIHGGAQRQLALLAAEHARSGHDVHVALVQGGVNLARLADTPVSVHTLGNGRYHDPRILLRLLGLVRRIRPHVVQSWLTQMDVFAGLAARVAGVPWILSERASREAYANTWKDRLRIMLARHATAIVSNAEAGDQYWQAFAPASVSRFVVPNGVPLDEIAGVAASWGDLGIHRDAPIILFVGRLVEQKNVSSLLRALPAVFARTASHVVIVGDGPQRPLVIDATRRPELAGRVHLAGYRTDVWNLMKAAAVFVSPSWFEGHPNTVLEAMACGCPVVVSDIPEHRAFLDASCARLLPPDDSPALAEAIIDTIQHREDGRNRAAAATGRASQFSVARAAQRYTDIYAAIADDGLREADPFHRPPARHRADQHV